MSMSSRMRRVSLRYRLPATYGMVALLTMLLVGAILLLLIEMVMQRDLSLNVKEAVFKVGFVFIMMLLAFAIFNDISRYARG